MPNLPVYTVTVTVTLSGAVISNARVIVRNERSNNTLSADTDSNGQTILNAANMTNGVVTGDILSIFSIYQNNEGSVQHTVTSGGVDISLALTAAPAIGSLRYFTVQNFYNEMSYRSTDSDLPRAVDIVDIGVDVEKEIDEMTGQRFDSANAVSNEYLDMKDKYQKDF